MRVTHNIIIRMSKGRVYKLSTVINCISLGPLIIILHNSTYGLLVHLFLSGIILLPKFFTRSIYTLDT